MATAGRIGPEPTLSPAEAASALTSIRQRANFCWNCLSLYANWEPGTEIPVPCAENTKDGEAGGMPC